MARCLVCNSSYDPATRHGPEDCRIARVDESIAVQLQRSIERNSRMVTRLKALRDQGNECDPRKCVIDDIDAILRDEGF